MGNAIMEQCTGESSKLQGFNGDLSIINHSSSNIERPKVLTIPQRIPQVESAYQMLLSQKMLEYSLQSQKSTFTPIQVLFYSDWAVYIGWTKSDKPHGPGQLYFPNHNYLQALFKEGEADCEDAILIDSKGNSYRGAFSKSKKHGFGVMKRGDETIIANFHYGFAQGKGEKLFKDGRIYRGLFKNDKMEGKGILKLPGNEVYEGHFRDDMRNGVGVFRTAHYEYFGPYKDDKMEGKGTIIFNDGSKFEGWFQGDMINGYGEWHRPNTPIEKGTFNMDLPK